MISWEVISPYLAPAGLAILVLTFVIRLRKQYRHEAVRQRQRQVDAARDVPSNALSSNGGRGVPRQPSRLLKPDTPFSGQDTTHNLVRWELEIDALGRQTIGQINSKMVALQTLLLEAERLTNRVELVLERLEQSGDLLAKMTSPPRTEKVVERAIERDVTSNENIDEPANQENPPLLSATLDLPPMPRQLTETPLSIDALFSEHTPRTRSVGTQDRSSERQRDASLLFDYGYTPREIASRLNASVGEVESFLKATG
ncbi:MAG: hypothetical protein ACRC46_02220 [Thermoguttaceae bacterium]